MSFGFLSRKRAHESRKHLLSTQDPLDQSLPFVEKTPVLVTLSDTCVEEAPLRSLVPGQRLVLAGAVDVGSTHPSRAVIFDNEAIAVVEEPRRAGRAAARLPQSPQRIVGKARRPCPARRHPRRAALPLNTTRSPLVAGSESVWDWASASAWASALALGSPGRMHPPPRKTSGFRRRRTQSTSSGRR